ncbi:tripartite tricarboxylate transporter TctB family protein [Aestuariirhabdus litorea]|uniref:Tripartite tricarboxylate transporter TctB family protein n=1 Tax=Aestuariirhabdus litorea TaxID=2528527 RepID=A0A3P3VRQ4_9GAMM|nr:tripartite tricarboxylate transporter TctB family protein [Aestuariirhabdus litorea]RWW98654.1 tripartite tricarboxylate transporter TctB family protein [Endozoicomonadaceae bacterium GTF-13]
MYDRIFAGTGLLLSGLVVWAALAIEVPFQYEPLGPKAFPIILATLLAISCLWLLIKPDADSWKPSGSLLLKLGSALVAMYLYARLYEPAGFIIATTLVGGYFCWAFGQKPLKAGAYALVMSVLSYFLLTSALQLNVPLGTLFGG